MKNIIYLIVFIIAAQLSVYSQTPTKWRGPNANGIYNDTGLLKEWPTEGPSISWVHEGIGEGYSSPAFANEKIYLSGMIDSIGYLRILTLEGKLIDTISYGLEWYGNYPGARSTPTVVDNLIYLLNSQGSIICIDEEQSTVKWSKDILKEYSAENLKFGITESVVVDGDVVYCTPGGKHAIVALNRFTGEEIWASDEKGEKSAYCTPLLANFPKRDILFTHTSSHIIAVDKKSGELIWDHPYKSQRGVQPNTPILYKGDLYCVAGYGHYGIKLNLDEQGNKVEEAWIDSILDCKMGGPVIIDDHIYGSSDKKRKWHCINWETGKQTYVDKTIAKGIVIAAEGMLYCYSEKGELALVKATPEAFTPSGLIKVTQGTGHHFAHPAINEGVLYLRHGDVVIAYDIKKHEPNNTNN
ncbi:PQQ-binding-like beta-propeller repeat protein [Bacteroidales bacterium]|nr:PQQ-binding-like beta-propeller repeat protein [Bacteroidales bacterium]